MNPIWKCVVIKKEILADKLNVRYTTRLTFEYDFLTTTYGHSTVVDVERLAIQRMLHCMWMRLYGSLYQTLNTLTRKIRLHFVAEPDDELRELLTQLITATEETKPSADDELQLKINLHK